ncbi:MAG: ABC transporter permease [Candidatus Sericytochromatia bacterium]|nr:ABC transporter permease [Candidatus Sericytochromatia bacterium]
MLWFDLLLTVLRTLKANRLRATLTLLGVMTGVGTLVLLSSVVNGGLSAIGRTVQEASGSDILRARVDRWTAEGKRVRALDSQDLRALRLTPILQKGTVLPQRLERSDITLGGTPVRTWCVGTVPQAPQVYQLEVLNGRFLSREDVESHSRVAVLGPNLADAVVRSQGTNNIIGREIKVWEKRFRVIGVLARKPTLRVDSLTWNDALAMPETTFSLLRGNRDIDTILIKAPRAENISDILPALSVAIRATLLWRSHQSETLHVRDSSPTTSGERTFLAALQWLSVGVAIICLLAGGINLMNIMLVTVSERTREIGIRLALGARRVDIRTQFLGEAVALSAFGGAMGVVLGLFGSWVVSVVLTHVLGFWPWVVEYSVIGLAFSAALLVGVLFGWYPAERASKFLPIECLRYE